MEKEFGFQLKTDKSEIFSSTKGKINITIVPSFNPYFYATEKKYYKKSISPIVEKIKETSDSKDCDFRWNYNWK